MSFRTLGNLMQTQRSRVSVICGASRTGCGNPAERSTFSRRPESADKVSQYSDF